MATERKFAISLTPSQPGYEATYSTLNALFMALGNLDLVALDQKIIIEVFDDFGKTTVNLTGPIDLSGWVSRVDTDHDIVVRAAPGAEVEYPSGVGASIYQTNFENSFESNVRNDISFSRLGLYAPGTVVDVLYEDSVGTSLGVIDRCFMERAVFVLSAFGRVSNNVMRVPNSSSATFIWGNFSTADFYCNTLIAAADTTLVRLAYRVSNMQGCVLTHEVGATGVSGAQSSLGDYNASFDDTAPGLNSIINIVNADEFVSDSDFHLIETSQLRGAAPNFFGNGYDKDIDGDDRPNAPWDIGGDQWTSGEPPVTPGANAIMHGTEF